MNDLKSSVSAQKVELLLCLNPIIMDEKISAMHGGERKTRRKCGSL